MRDEVEGSTRLVGREPLVEVEFEIILCPWENLVLWLLLSILEIAMRKKSCGTSSIIRLFESTATVD